MEIIYNLYPKPNRLRNFTDGPFPFDQPNAGTGVSSNLFVFYTPVGASRTVFEGEIGAISIALKQLFYFLDKFSSSLLYKIYGNIFFWTY